MALLFAGYTKSAQFPTYSWIPDAMEAPTPASAFLHGAAMVEMGGFTSSLGFSSSSAIFQSGFSTSWQLWSP
ncbi:proton-conducting transporter transmembrane domain-containing protein [Thermococcus peptonophilus]|uniref:proton-conducting transporter transmembrane domain-containing protein n=1 Tax=Thermococcus peptonophilus TaxID=53952 RepID=UPI003467C7D0